MEEEKKFEYVEQQELEVKEIKLELDNPDIIRIKKIRITTNIGDITWKPKIERTQFVSGFKTTRMDMMTIDDMPEILKKIQHVVTESGKCKIKASYQLFNTTNPEGTPVQYRFITSGSFLEKWEILTKPETKEEKIV